MSKIKLTKGELKRQRESLKQFEHYLPTLQLKKQQLQIRINEARKKMQDLVDRQRQQEESIRAWAGLLAEAGDEFEAWITPRRIVTETANVAGADIPVFVDARFDEAVYDYYAEPLWIDEGLNRLREWIKSLAAADIQQKQIDILHRELRVTTQRVNLFEKVKIPEATENIRVIRIYLGDQQANAVGIAKVAKSKIQSAR